MKSIFLNGFQIFFGSKYIKIESVTQPKAENKFAQFLQNIFANFQFLKVSSTILLYLSEKWPEKIPDFETLRFNFSKNSERI